MFVADATRAFPVFISSARTLVVVDWAQSSSRRRIRSPGVGLEATLITREVWAASSGGKGSVAVLKQFEESSRRVSAELVVEVQAPPGVAVTEKASLDVKGVDNHRERISTQGELLSRSPEINGSAGLSDPCFGSVVHQLEISLLQLRLLPASGDLASEIGDGEQMRLQGSERDTDASEAKEEQTSVHSQLPRRKKKIWRGICKPRRMPPQPPWTEDDFKQKTKLILEAILAESIESRVLVEDVLNSWRGKITRIELTNLIRELGLQREPLLALEVFFWMQKQKGRLKPGAHACCAMIGMLGRAGLADNAWEIFEARKSLENQDLVFLYNAMMGAYVKCGKVIEAWTLYEELCTSGLVADRVTFNTLLSAMSREDVLPEVAQKLLSEMKDAGISPDSYTYNTLIMILSKSGNILGTAALIEEMRSANKMPDLCTFNTVIKMYGRAGMYKEALQVLNILKSAGLKPNSITYTSLMQMFNRADNLEAAMGQFSEMQRVGCTPDIVTYILAIDIYLKSGQPEDAERTLKQMQKAGFPPNVGTWNAIVQAYCKRGMVEKAGSCFAEMQKSGCKPDATLLNVIMTAYKQAALPLFAATLFRSMQSQGVAPNAACYNTLIHTFVQCGQVEDAKALHEQMIKAGFTPDKVTSQIMGSSTKGRGK